MSIPFTQYLLPDGRMKEITIDRPMDVEAKAGVVMFVGLRFEAEVLTTGEVSLTVFDPEEEVDVEIEVVQNGPGLIGPAVDRLVARAHALVNDRWLHAILLRPRANEFVQFFDAGLIPWSVIKDAIRARGGAAPEVVTDLTGAQASEMLVRSFHEPEAVAAGRRNG